MTSTENSLDQDFLFGVTEGRFFYRSGNELFLKGVEKKIIIGKFLPKGLFLINRRYFPFKIAQIEVVEAIEEIKPHLNFQNCVRDILSLISTQHDKISEKDVINELIFRAIAYAADSFKVGDSCNCEDPFILAKKYRIFCPNIKSAVLKSRRKFIKALETVYYFILDFIGTTRIAASHLPNEKDVSGLEEHIIMVSRTIFPKAKCYNITPFFIYNKKTLAYLIRLATMIYGVDVIENILEGSRFYGADILPIIYSVLGYENIEIINSKDSIAKKIMQFILNSPPLKGWEI